MHNHFLIRAKAENLNFVMITESWLNVCDRHQIAETTLNGYNVFIKCCLHKNGGCISLYVSNGIKVKFSKTVIGLYDSPYVEVVEKNKEYVHYCPLIT